MQDRETRYGFETLAIHAGQEPEPRTGAVVPPIYQTSTYAQDAVGAPRLGYEYSRSGNPTRDALQECLAALEGGRRGLAFASGLAAEDTLLRTVCKPGDHVVIPDDAYGGTYRLFAKVAERWGLALHPGQGLRPRRRPGRDPARPARRSSGWRRRPTRCSASPTSPRWPRVAHDAGALLVVDNTFASPYLQQPIAHGADVVVHSTTKYIGGHSDVVGGALVAADDGAGRGAALPPERDGRGQRPVRRLAHPARRQDPGRTDGPALRQRRADRRVPGRAPRKVGRGALPGPARRTPATRWPPSRCAGSAA